MASILKVDQIQTAAGGTPTAADLGLNTTGSVLQVVHSQLKTTVSSTANLEAGLGNWTDTGLSVTITPSSASSSVHISGHINVASSLDHERISLRLVDGNGNEVLVGTASGNRPAVISNANCPNVNAMLGQPFECVHSPNTTNAITYKIQAAANGGAPITWYINRTRSDADGVYYPRGVSTITAMEIAG